MDEQAYIQALIRLHQGLERQGPGDQEFSLGLLARLPAFDSAPRITDMGCGAGIASLMLARYFDSPVEAVDFSNSFLQQLKISARQQGLEQLIHPHRGDMGNLDWPLASIDLLWSEGAAYAIGFANALQVWRPLMASRGVVVISELSYFGAVVPTHLVDSMQGIYPDIQTEAANQQLISDHGYNLLETCQLPAQAWWDNYYDPLKAKVEGYRNDRDPVMRQVLQDTEAEMEFFRHHGDQCGYSFYIMQVD